MPEYKIWVLSDGRSGVRNQCIGVAQRLGSDIDVIKMQDIESAGGLPSFFKKRFGEPITSTDKWPDIVISSGKEMAMANRSIKKLSKNSIFSISVTNPGKHFMDFDVIATVKHTYKNWPLSSKTIEIIGVSHKVTPESLEQGRQEWSDIFSAFQGEKPIFAALIGGDTEKGVFTEEDGANLGKLLNNVVKKEEGSLLITNSPRISVPSWRALRNEINDVMGYTYDCRVAIFTSVLL